MFRFRALAAGACTALAAFAALPLTTAVAAPPAPCNNAPQITDANGDGHHGATDVLAAWWSEANGRLQVVSQVRAATPLAEHNDTADPAAVFAVVYVVAGETRYVRARLPLGGTPTYDHGTYTAPAGFTSAGPTTGVVETGANGTVTIDVPAVAAGTVLSRPFVFTWDGPDPVDHAPGGITETDPAVGADYVVGSCNAAPPPGTAVTTTSVQLKAPASVKGRKTVTVSGKVLPARAGVPVTITRTANNKQADTRVSSAADGSFSARIAIAETSDLRAVAESIGSPELTVTARSTVKIKVRNHKDGSATVTGTVDPKLPGRIQWLRSNAVTPSARTTTRSNGSFTLRLKKPKRGRYQVVFIPSGERAERSVSNTGVIR